MQKLTDQLYFLRGAVANLTASIGPEGILLVDCDLPSSVPMIRQALAEVSSAPVKYVIDTHWHDDHTGGNAAFARDGATVIGHASIIDRMRRPQFLPHFKIRTEAAPVEAWPRLTFADELALRFNGEELHMFYLGPAHSDSDVIVHFPASNVLSMGDIYINGLYPIIDRGSAGTIDGYFPMIERALALADGETKVLPGHGPLGDKKSLLFYRDMLLTLRDRIGTMKRDGKSLAEIEKSNPTKEFDPEWSTDRVSGPQVTGMIFESMA